jgi:hypothetical protein
VNFDSDTSVDSIHHVQLDGDRRGSLVFLATGMYGDFTCFSYDEGRGFGEVQVPDSGTDMSSQTLAKVASVK